MISRILARRTHELPEAPDALPVEPVPERLLQGVLNSLLAGETHYTERPGLGELREQIAKRLEALGLTSGRDASTVVVTAGETEALYVARLAAKDAPLVSLGDAIFGPEAEGLSPPGEDALLAGSLDALEGLASFRVGFLSAPPHLVAGVCPWKQALSICTAAPSQRAALLALEPT